MDDVFERDLFVYPDLFNHAEHAIADACADMAAEIALVQSLDEALKMHLRVQLLLTQMEHICAATLERADAILKARDTA